MIDLFPNETVLFQWVIFMIALLTLHWGIFRPVLKILKERDSRTSGARESARDLDQKAEELAALCSKKVEEAREEGIRQKNGIREAGEKSVEDLLRKTRREIDGKIEEIRKRIEGEGREASLQLKQYAQEIGREIASKVLDREV